MFRVFCGEPSPSHPVNPDMPVQIYAALAGLGWFGGGRLPRAAADVVGLALGYNMSPSQGFGMVRVK